MTTFLSFSIVTQRDCVKLQSNCITSKLCLLKLFMILVKFISEAREMYLNNISRVHRLIGIWRYEIFLWTIILIEHLLAQLLPARRKLVTLISEIASISRRECYNTLFRSIYVFEIIKTLWTVDRSRTID